MARNERVQPVDSANFSAVHRSLQAQIGRLQGGAIWLRSLAMVTPFALPADVPLEKS